MRRHMKLQILGAEAVWQHIARGPNPYILIRGRQAGREGVARLGWTA